MLYMTTKTQRYELEAWLGDDHGLSEDQIVELIRVSDEIDARYPDEDDRGDCEAALTVAYRLMVEDPTVVVDELAADLLAARQAERTALVGIRQAAVMLIGHRDGLDVGTQAGFARRAGVDRMAIRQWLGLRS